jgi:hypothetical protein
VTWSDRSVTQAGPEGGPRPVVVARTLILSGRVSR